MTPLLPSELVAVAEKELDVEEEEARAARACHQNGISSECANLMRIRTAT